MYQLWIHTVHGWKMADFVQTDEEANEVLRAYGVMVQNHYLIPCVVLKAKEQP